MGYNTLSQSGHTTYGIKEFVVDSKINVKNFLINISMNSAILKNINQKELIK